MIINDVGKVRLNKLIAKMIHMREKGKETHLGASFGKIFLESRE